MLILTECKFESCTFFGISPTFLAWPSQRGFAGDAGIDDRLAHMLHGSGDSPKASLRAKRCEADSMFFTTRTFESCTRVSSADRKSVV